MSAPVKLLVIQGYSDQRGPLAYINRLPRHLRGAIREHASRHVVLHYVTGSGTMRALIVLLEDVRQVLASACVVELEDFPFCAHIADIALPASLGGYMGSTRHDPPTVGLWDLVTDCSNLGVVQLCRRDADLLRERFVRYTKDNWKLFPKYPRSMVRAMTKSVEQLTGAAAQLELLARAAGAAHRPVVGEMSLQSLSGRTHVTDIAFLAGENTARDARWPGFPEWCLQDTSVALGPLIFGMRNRKMETVDALALVREQLKGKLVTAVSAMSMHWPRVGLWVPPVRRSRNVSSKIVTTEFGTEAPPNWGKTCLVWVARMDTLEEAFRQAATPAELCGLGRLRFVVSAGARGAQLSVAPRLDGLPEPQASH